MMASLGFSNLPTTSTITSHRLPLFSKTSSSHFTVSCNANANSNSEYNPKLILPKQNVDRRDMLLGLGAGLYGAANIGSALAIPISAPSDTSTCVRIITGVQDPDNALRGVACCPPPSPGIVPSIYNLPQVSELRIRPAAQRLTPEYVEKYKAAIAAMKALPADDPHSWKSQAKIHCAYCFGGYFLQLADGVSPDLKLQVHNSSLFFPFHRWYIYFYERILGKLTGDETFALPYWNWDNPTGMMLPAVFEEPGPNGNPRTNPLFDPYRNVGHLPPTIIDLQFRGTESGASCVDQISANLATMYGQMVTNATTTEAFFGTNYTPDTGVASKPGTIESGSHASVHIWTGNPRMPNREDLGNFYSAGYDPLFFIHHANVDRMWTIWNDLSPSNTNPTDSDWKLSSFVFYDENRRLVRVFNSQCTDHRLMGYNYEDSRIPWIQNRPIARVKASNVAADSVGVVKTVEEMEFPVKLDQTVKVLVKRPATSRTADEKKEATEMLFLNGIKYNSEQFFKFDVLVDDVDDGIETTAASSEFAGTFAQVPHNHGHDMFMTTGTAFGITQLLEDIQADGDEYVLVTLVPRAGTEDATISEINIQLVPLA